MINTGAFDNVVTAIRNGLENLEYYPGKNGVAENPYIPNPSDSPLERFTKAMGIGHQEGSRNAYYVKTGAGYQVKEPHLDQKINAKANAVNAHIPYALPFWQSIEDTAYGPWRRNDAFIQQQIKSQGYSPDIISDAGYMLGRIGADVAGYGTRSRFWNAHPEDRAGIIGSINIASDENLKRFGVKPGYTSELPDGTKVDHYNLGIKNWVRSGAAIGLGLGAGNWSITNLQEGGRPAGFEAVSADENDPTQSTQPFVDLVVNRGLFGRTSRLLPWEEFRLERPDVTFEEYQNYKDYLYNRDPGPINNLTQGLIKTNMEGLDGESPEVRIMGYRVTPEGILGAAAGAAVPILAIRVKQGLARV